MMIIFVMLLGLLLRVSFINQSLWLDEATTALVGSLSLKDILVSFLPGDFHPPLYYLLMKGWVSVFGLSELSLRIPSLMFGTATIYSVYLTAKEVFNRKAAIIAAILIATNGLAIYYSQEARMYSLTAFLVTLAFYFYVKKSWSYFAAALAFIGGTDYLALLILPVFWFFSMKKKEFYIACIPLVIFSLLWAPVFFTQLQSGLAVKSTVPGWWGILGSFSLKNIILIPVKFITGRISLTSNAFYLWGFGFMGIIYAWLMYKIVNKARLLWLWLSIPIIIAIIVSLKVPVLSYFRLLFCLPAMVILVAGSLSLLKKPYSIFFTGLIIMANILASLAYLTNPVFHRENWRDLVKFVEGRKSENSITVFVKDSNMEAYRYYSPDAKITGPAGLNGSYDQIWVMDYLADVFDPDGKVVGRVKSLGYTYIGGYSFNGVNVSEYRK